MSENTDKTIKELGFGQYLNPKKKKTQPQTPNVPQGRDLFQTPNYAVDLLVPYIPKEIDVIWECAAGRGKIVQRLTERGYSVFPSDILIDSEFPMSEYYNFLLGNEENTIPYPIWEDFQTRHVSIITNPPFSLKQKFYYKCLEYKVPFALLIPADYSGWIIDAVRIDRAEKIIPTRRIDFITPSGKSGATGNTSNFHSMWLTWGFNLGRTETYVELSNEEKKENI